MQASSYPVIPLDFSGQNLRGRSFKRQNLEGANFSYADIRSTNFTGATLTGGYIPRGIVHLASLIDVDDRHAKILAYRLSTVSPANNCCLI
jgi:uncharacterized protein YjbI with pentapeptide repeats